jgi:hypothetical protein
MAIEPRRTIPPPYRNRIRGLCAVGLGLVTVGLGVGCGSGGNQPHHPSAGATSAAGGGRAATCQTALAQYAAVQRDLSGALSNPSDPAAAKRLDADAETLKPSLAKLVAATPNVDQQAALSQYRSELRDVQTALTLARGGNASTAVGMLRASAGQLGGLPTLIHALCRT